MADGRHTEAEELAEHALAVAEDFARPDLTASALQARGTARVDRGDLRGAGDFESAVETCRRYGLSPARALGGLGWASARTGDLGRFSGIRAEAMDAAERYGDVLTLRMLRGRAVIEHYWAGEWDEADELATRMLRGAEPDWLPARASWHVVRGRIALARGDHPAATGDAVRGLAIARPAGPRELGPALAFAARIALVRGKTAEARRLAEELLTALRGRTIPAAVGIDLPVVLAALGQGVAAFAGLRWSPWLAAAEAFLRGDLATAAEGYYWIGSRPDRLAARSLRTVA